MIWLKECLNLLGVVALILLAWVICALTAQTIHGLP